MFEAVRTGVLEGASTDNTLVEADKVVFSIGQHEKDATTALRLAA